MLKTPRTHRNMFWEHLTLPNIGNSRIDLQISTLGITIGPQNLPFRPPVSQETFWISDSCFWIFDDQELRLVLSNYDYDFPTPSAWWQQSLRREVFEKETFPFDFFYKTRKLQQLLFFFVILCTHNYRFSRKLAPFGSQQGPFWESTGITSNLAGFIENY